MLATEMYAFRDALREQGMIFCYSGYVTEPVLTGIGEALKQKLVLEEADRKTMRNVFAIFVEEMQNIIRYSAEREPLAKTDEETELRYGVLSIGMTEGKFYVSCGNMILKEDVDRLNGRLARLQKLDGEEIKKLDTAENLFISVDL